MTNYINLTRHAREERITRLSTIVAEVGLGQYILEECYVHNGRECVARVTNTGLFLAFSIKENKEVLITGFLLSIDRAMAIYRHSGYHHIPNGLYNTIRRNAKKYKHLLHCYE